MTNFQGLKRALEAKKASIFGQFVGVVSVSSSQFDAAHKKLGYKKVTRYNVRIAKKSFLSTVNTSTGAQAVGVVFTPKRDSYYEDEYSGLLEHLKADPEKKYVRLVWDSDKRNTVESCYVDGDGNIIGTSIEDVRNFITPSAYKKATEGYGRQVHQKAMGIEVHEVDIGYENIAELKVCKIHMIDKALKKYIPLVR
jgi:hypothetical protein